MASAAAARTGDQLHPMIFWALNGVIAFWLINTSGAIFPLLAVGSGTSSQLDDAVRSKLRYLLLPSLALAPILFVMRFRAIVLLCLRNPLLLLILAWVFASTTWSLAPDITARRALGLLINTLLACYLVADRSVEQIIRLLAWCFLFLLLASLALILLTPELATMPDGRGLRGVFVHKNLMGETVAVSIIIFFAALKAKAIRRWVGLTGMALALILLLPVGAASSLVAAMVILAIQIYALADFLPFRARIIILAFAASLAALISALLFAHIDLAFGLLGRDATLTGRTPIWSFVLTMSDERPWLGYGYACFWEIERFAGYATDVFDWSVPSSHNGYLDILLGLGWIGLSLFLSFLAAMIYRLATRWRRLSPSLAMFALQILLFYALLNLADTTMLASSGLSWILMAIAALKLTPGFSSERDEMASTET
jgi:exopolysaccharide production protein ExoQ